MLKQITLSATAIACMFTNLCAQTITNGSFENWDSIVFADPTDWVSSNLFTYTDGGHYGVTKVAGHTGFAIKIATVSSPNYADASGIMNTNLSIWDGKGGQPYNQQPTAITGYYKCDIQLGDSAIILVIFKKNGVIISEDWFKIAGQQTSFVPFSFPLSLASQPDSVCFFASSSDVDLGNEAIGSYIILDELKFTGTNITQQMTDADFENWHNYTYKTPTNWGREATGVDITTDAHTGNFATQITTVNYLGDVYIGGIYYGERYFYSFVAGGIPYTQDTLVFYYKYMPVNNDSANIEMEYSLNGNPIYHSDFYLHAVSTYTRAEIPLKSIGTPDTVRWAIYSSTNDNEMFVGSRLIVDDIHLKSEETATGITLPNKSTAKVYPNPAADNITIISATTLQNAQINIYDMMGRRIDEINISGPFDAAAIPVAHLQKGVYLYQINTENGVVATGKFRKD